MKRIILLSTFITSANLTLFAGKWDTATKAIYIATKEPEKTFEFFGFIIDLFLMCIPIAIVAGVVSIILKSVFDLDKEDVQKSFFLIAGILLVISLLIYFLI